MKYGVVTGEFLSRDGLDAEEPTRVPTAGSVKLTPHRNWWGSFARPSHHTSFGGNAVTSNAWNPKKETNGGL